MLLQVSGFLAAPARTSLLLSPQPLFWVEETSRDCPPAASASGNRVEPPPSSSATEMGKRLDLEFSSPSPSPFVRFIKAFLLLGTSFCFGDLCHGALRQGSSKGESHEKPQGQRKKEGLWDPAGAVSDRSATSSLLQEGPRSHVNTSGPSQLELNSHSTSGHTVHPI